MVTILAGTALDITLEQKKQLVERVSSAISKINSEYSFFYSGAPVGSANGTANNQVTYYVFMPESAPKDQRRAIVKALTDQTLEVIGFRSPRKVIVIFKYFQKGTLGVGGKLCTDMM